MKVRYHVTLYQYITHTSRGEKKVRLGPTRTFKVLQDTQHLSVTLYMKKERTNQTNRSISTTVSHISVTSAVKKSVVEVVVKLSGSGSLYYMSSSRARH
jgi:hypothetical protein